MKSRSIFLSAAASLLALSAAMPGLAKDRPTAVADDAAAAESAKPELGAWGIDLSARDLSVKPGADFFRYANGHWLDTVEIPEDRSRYGSFDMLRERSDEQVRAILDLRLSRDGAAR